MQRILLLLLVVLSFVRPAIAQKNGIRISGHVNPLFIKFYDCKELLVSLHDPINKLISPLELLKIPINKNGSFSKEIVFSSKFKYLSFWVVNNGNDINNQPGILLPIDFQQNGSTYIEGSYFFEIGDDIKMGVSENGNLSFSGKGADKLNCQYRINSLDFPASEKRIYELLQSNDYDMAFDLQMDIMDLIIKMRIKILDSYKDKFTEQVYRSIYMDAVINTKASELNFFSQKKSEERSKDEDFIKSFKSHFENWVTQDKLITTDSAIILSSKNYSLYCFDKEFITYGLLNGNLKKDDVFVDIYNIIRSKYSGKLRDQLLLICFDRLSLNFKGNVSPYFKDAMHIASDKETISLLVKIEKRQVGSPAFPFELEDANGKIHKLSDFRGKVLVIDFWFTGCFWCSKLNDAMDPIINKYKDNKEIVFISVCEDQKKETWLKSLSSGVYTSSESVDLYTNGLGTEHPFLKFYNFSGAPQQLIINKAGYLVTASPPRPGVGLIYYYNKETGNPDDILNSVNGKKFLEILDLQLDKNNSK